MLTEFAPLCTGAAVTASVFVLVPAAERVVGSGLVRDARRSAARSVGQWRWLLRTAGDDIRAPVGAGRRLRSAAMLTGAICGFAILGPVGSLLGAVAGAPASTMLIRHRRARYARRVDASAADLALALASAMAAGHSVRGALLAAGRSVQQPAAAELDRVAVDITLGRTVEDSLAGLRERAASRRLDSIAGAIELHRRSGGDLVRLMRELAAAFRARDDAQRDARSATAQARFTALLVAVIPAAAAVIAELASPGAVSGALTYAPSALLLLCALGLFVVGGLLCLKVSGG